MHINTFLLLSTSICQRLLLYLFLVLPGLSWGQCFQRTDYPIGRDAISIAIADFNRDGKSDLAVANRRHYTNESGFGTEGPQTAIYRLLNNGSGGFGAGVNYVIEDRDSDFGTLFGITAGDFNRDGNPDIIANQYRNKIRFIPGDGSGLLGPSRDYILSIGYPAPNVYPGAVVTGDFNADGLPDVATTIGIYVLLNTGGGLGQPTKYSNLINESDFHGDGYDLQALTVVDLNADGWPDLVSVAGEHLSVLLNNGSGGFSLAMDSRNPDGDYLRSVAAGDFNADGRPDIVMAVSNRNYVKVAFGNGRGGFDYITPIEVGADNPNSVKVGDFNGDGKDDIVTANGESNSVSVLLGNGTYGFATPSVTPLGDRSVFGLSHAYLEVGDFNGDHRTDIVTANREDQTISVLLSTLPPTVPSLQTIRGQSYPGDQSEVTVVQNSGSVLLLGSCASGLLNWTSSDGQHGRSNSSGTVTIIVPTTATGVFSYTSTCQIGTCTSPGAIARVTVVTPPPPFLITGVTDVLCVRDGTGGYRVGFNPQYSGLNGNPVTFSVHNELAPTTAFGPYQLHLYADNPTINLQAQQLGTPTTALFDFNWLASCTTPLPNLSIRYVKPVSSGTGDGSSWANASNDLRAMLRASTVGNQVWVAAGTYKTTPVSTSATAVDRSLSFVIPSGVQVYGNFVGIETSLNQRRLSYPLNTILSGEIGLPTTSSIYDNTYHVVTFQNVAAGTLLDGFVVRDGGTYTNTELPRPPGGYVGAGIFNASTTGQTSSPTIQNCHITQNRAGFSGGGMFNDGEGTATLINCLFSANYGEHGGAILSSYRIVGAGNIASGFTVNIINCSLVGNASDQEGKAIAGGRLMMRNSLIWANLGGSSISALQNIDYTDSHISYSIVQEGAASGLYMGSTVQNVDPQFISLYGATPDYHLQATSPAINTGDLVTTGLLLTDLAGNARVAGSRVDMGVFEYGSAPLTSTFTLLTPAYNCGTGAFTFRTEGSDGRAVEYRAVPGISDWTTNPNQFLDAVQRVACDAPAITLQARFVGQPASEITRLWSVREVCPACGSEARFAIIGITEATCMITGPTERRLTFTPQYSGTNGQPITFQVLGELAPTTTAGPYSLRLYTDNPTIHLQAQQTGTTGVTSFDYNWLASCTGGARLGTGATEPALTVRVLGSPTTDNRVEVDVEAAVGQRLHFMVTNAQGQLIDEFWVDQSHAGGRQWIKLGRIGGVYLLRVSTSTQSQLVKILKQ